MKINRLVISILTILISSEMFSQKNTCLGFETAISKDISEFSDNGDRLKSYNSFGSGLLGVTIEREVNNYITISTGIIRKYYNIGYSIDLAEYPVRTTLIQVMNSWQIPLRFTTRMNLFEEKISLSTLVGINYCSNSVDKYRSIYDKDTLLEDKTGSVDTLILNKILTPELTKSFFLLKTGIGIDFRILKKTFLTLSTSYNTGFRKISQLDVNYQVNSSVMNGKIYSKGEYWDIGIGLKYTINNIKPITSKTDIE